jgi:uncharacterized Fe-S cluster-containing radical SAM superfamily protein
VPSRQTPASRGAGGWRVAGPLTPVARRQPGHWLVQLPFPSMTDPHPALQAYYEDYSRVFAQALPGYFVPDAALWEMPLWIAHLAGMLESLGIEPRFLDLAGEDAMAAPCVRRILAATEPHDFVYFSPLAQNFDLAREVSRRLQRQGRRTLIGGNMAALSCDGDATLIHRGQLSPPALERLLRGGSDIDKTAPVQRRGRVSWTPSYDLLKGYSDDVPLVRLNASHGCLFRCSFCGDAWSRQLHVVERDALQAEVAALTTRFPNARIVYVGDKSFGQSKEAVRNLIDVFADRPGYSFIVQTHALLVNESLVESMHRLGVVAVELGLESGDPELLGAAGKATKGNAHYVSVIRMLEDEGLRVVLNVLGGLPRETQRSHQRTIEFLEACADSTWLYNLYNFVPYPLTPYFPELRERIFDWRFASWREDAPPVFQPYHLSPSESWDLFLEKVQLAHEAVRARVLEAGATGLSA